MTAVYKVLVKRSAEKELKRVPKADLLRIVERIGKLAGDPRPQGCEKLFDGNCYRIRQGDYRVLYTVDDERRVVEVYKIGHRREVYR